MKKPVLVVTIADKNNLVYAKMMINSLRKFHDWPVVLVTDEKDPKQLPKDVILEDLELYKADLMFFYRSTPIICEKYLKEYELVIKLDADQIITGDLSYVLKTTDYDVATVINWNRVDPAQYGLVQGWGILPIEYFNCGFVAMRSEKFVHHWGVICKSPQFDRMQYKEQDLLNILCYYGNYNIRCLDHGDGLAKYTAWHGLIAKGEWLKAKMVGNDIVIPKAADNFPKIDTLLKVIHWAGGNSGAKMNYRTAFSEEVIKRLDYLVSDSK